MILKLVMVAFSTRETFANDNKKRINYFSSNFQIKKKITLKSINFLTGLDFMYSVNLVIKLIFRTISLHLFQTLIKSIRIAFFYHGDLLINRLFLKYVSENSWEFFWYELTGVSYDTPKGGR